jgi:hypothetical protein
MNPQQLQSDQALLAGIESQIIFDRLAQIGIVPQNEKQAASILAVADELFNRDVAENGGQVILNSERDDVFSKAAQALARPGSVSSFAKRASQDPSVRDAVYRLKLAQAEQIRNQLVGSASA